MKEINLDASCVRCGSDQYTEERDGHRFCTLCWKRQKPIPHSLRVYIEALKAAQQDK